MKRKFVIRFGMKRKIETSGSNAQLFPHQDWSIQSHSQIMFGITKKMKNPATKLVSVSPWMIFNQDARWATICITYGTHASWIEGKFLIAHVVIQVNIDIPITHMRNARRKDLSIVERAWIWWWWWPQLSKRETRPNIIHYPVSAYHNQRNQKRESDEQTINQNIITNFFSFLEWENYRHMHSNQN